MALRLEFLIIISIGANKLKRFKHLKHMNQFVCISGCTVLWPAIGIIRLLIVIIGFIVSRYTTRIITLISNY